MSYKIISVEEEEYIQFLQNVVKVNRSEFLEFNRKKERPDNS